MLSINTNLSGLMVSSQIARNDAALGKSLQRLSSGLRVSSAADGAGELGMSHRLMAEIRGCNAALQGANNGVSMLQVADGALDSTLSALQRMRELAVEASSSTASSTDRTNLDAEFQQLAVEVTRIANTTLYAGTAVLMGSLQYVNIMTGAYSGMFISLGSLNNVCTFSTLTGGTPGTLALTGATNTLATSAITTVDVAIASVASVRARIGAYQTSLDVISSTLQSIVQADTQSNSQLVDTDIAAETANLTKNNILKQAGLAVLSQANQNFGSVLTLLQRL
ncbi:MAG: flagellin FliC [Magnetococcales bacterium]|nr:flagellin FliC [Magnetococcales bacterium]